MDVKMVLKLAFKGIIANKMRTFLTMLGIIIGVSAVIILVALAQGTTQSVTESIESMGTNLITVTITGRGTDTTLSYDEVMKFSEKEGVSGISPVVSGNVTAKYGNNSTSVSLEGVDSNYETVRNHSVQTGRFIKNLDVEYRNKIVILGTEVVDEIFNGINPVGKDLQINGTKFKVVGVLEKKGSSMGGSNDEKILTPISTAQRFLKSTGVKNFYIQAKSSDEVEIVENQTEISLLKKFENDDDSYRIFNQSEMLSTMDDVTKNMTLMLGGIAAISLLVGGIGIMNIMLVSVTERTKEIGIRKAIGAKRKDILNQFLLESAVISGLGGIVGILTGIGGSSLLTVLVGLNTSISITILIISFGFSLVVGVFFGMYPANKASKLEPVDALRFE
ncbi:MAG: FtsX-like permease family protein [Firmicutes bacterium]|nr:FtsX-like permease family protein [Bacillota bacterium]